jgi:hypothetical protein
MANTYTPTYNILKPEVGSDTNAWGTHVNADFDIIDTHMLSRALTTSQTAAGPMVFGQTLRVNGAVTFDSTMLVTGASTLNSLTTTGSASFGTTLSVTGAATLSSNLNVTGATTLSSNLSVAGSATFTNPATVATPVSSGHATTKAYVDTADALKLNLSGGTITGALTISNTGPSLYLTDTDGYNYMLYNNGNTCGIYRVGAGAWAFNTDTSGNFTSVGNITAYSDARLKKDVVTIAEPLTIVNRMRGVFYSRIEDDKPGVGVIAQEMREILPQVVHENDGTLSVAYGNIVGVLIEAVKELSAKVEALEERQ